MLQLVHQPIIGHHQHLEHHSRFQNQHTDQLLVIDVSRSFFSCSLLFTCWHLGLPLHFFTSLLVRQISLKNYVRKLLKKMPYQEICEYTGVLEKSTGTMTMYGSTATSPGSIDRQRFFNCLIDFFVKEFTNILHLIYIMVQPQKFTLGVRSNLAA